MSELDHIERLRAFRHLYTMGGGVMTDELRDALLLLDDYAALAARLADLERKFDLRRWSKAESDAWHRAIPDTEEAFHALLADDGSKGWPKMVRRQMERVLTPDPTDASQ